MPYQTVSLVAFLLVAEMLAFPGASPETRGEQLLPDPGVVSYTFRHQFAADVPGTLDLIREMGITNIEFSNLFGKTAEQMRSLLDARGLICTSYGVSYQSLVDEPRRVAAEARTLGAGYVRVAWIPHESPFTVEDAARAARDFNRAGRILKEEGLTFAYHNHGYEFRPHGDGTLFDYLAEQTDPDYVSFEMDLFWVAQPGHDPVALLERYPDRFTLVHLKDLKKGAVHDYSGSAPAGYDVPLGEGQIDIPAFLRAAQHSAVDYFYIEDESDDVINRVPRSLEYIKSLRK